MKRNKRQVQNLGNKIKCRYIGQKLKVAEKKRQGLTDLGQEEVPNLYGLETGKARQLSQCDYKVKTESENLNKCYISSRRWQC